PSRPLKIAVIGHVEHATIARVDALPSAGSILHLDDYRWIAGGGGAIAFFQLAKSAGEIHLFTALGNDDAAALVGERIGATGARTWWSGARRTRESSARSRIIARLRKRWY